MTAQRKQDLLSMPSKSYMSTKVLALRANIVLRVVSLATREKCALPATLSLPPIERMIFRLGNCRFSCVRALMQPCAPSTSISVSAASSLSFTSSQQLLPVLEKNICVQRWYRQQSAYGGSQSGKAGTDWGISCHAKA